MPLISPDSSWPATARPLRPHLLRLDADDDHAVEGAEVAAGAREEVAAHLLDQGAAADHLAADADAEGALRVRVLGDVGEAGLREVAGQPPHVDRLADDADADQARPGRPERFLDRVGDPARQVADREQPDPPAVELVADQDRVDAFGELVGAAEFAAQLLGAVTGVLRGCSTRLSSRFLRVLLSVSPPNSAPIRMPIASAMKTATSDTAW